MGARFAQHEGKGKGVGVPGRCSSPAKRPAKALAPGAGRRRHTSRRRARRRARERQKRSQPCRKAECGGRRPVRRRDSARAFSEAPSRRPLFFTHFFCRFLFIYLSLFIFYFSLFHIFIYLQWDSTNGKYQMLFL